MPSLPLHHVPAPVDRSHDPVVRQGFSAVLRPTFIGFCAPISARLAVFGAALLLALPAGAQTAAPAGDDPGVAAPAGGAAAGARGISYSGVGVPVERAIEAINRQAGGRSVVGRGKVLGQKVTLSLRNATFEQAVQGLSTQQAGWTTHRPEDQPGTVEIWDQESYRAEVLPRMVRQKVFVPRNIGAEEAAKAVQGVLTGNNIGSVAFDARSNKVIVTDQPYVLEIVQRLLEQIDVDYVTRVFYITNADVQEIADKLANLRSSPAAPAPEVDLRTHQIIVRDRMDALIKMEKLIDVLDVGPDIRVYDINNVGVEGLDAEALEEALEKIITADAFYQLNELQGRLLLQDIPEVHEKVEKLLAALDQPLKQVLLQIEIIETDFSHGFNYSIDYTLSQDLFASVIDGLTNYQGGGTGPGGAGTGPQQTGAPGSAGFRGVPIPVSSRGGASVDRGDLGFLDFRREFPIASVGGAGLNIRALTENAFITLQAAMSDSRTRVLQQPRVLVANQKLVSFNVGQEIPYFTGGNGFVNNNNDTNNNFNSVAPQQTRVKVGLILDITPVISNNGLVQLEIVLTNSSAFFRDLQFSGQTFTGVGVNNQELNTTLIIPSGETRVIGGLLTDTESETVSGVPGLVRIPVIGPLLFGSYNQPADANRRRNLLIFLTPTIVKEEVTDLAKYRGRTVVDEAVDLLPPPVPATLTDIEIDPMPATFDLPSIPPLPEGPREKGMPPPDGWDASDGAVPPPPLDAGQVDSLSEPARATAEPAFPFPTPAATADLNDPTALPPMAPDALPPAGGGPRSRMAGNLQRIKVQDTGSTLAASIPRIPSISGGVGVGTGGQGVAPFVLSGGTTGATPGGPTIGASTGTGASGPTPNFPIPQPPVLPTGGPTLPLPPGGNLGTPLGTPAPVAGGPGVPAVPTVPTPALAPPPPTETQ